MSEVKELLDYAEKVRGSLIQLAEQLRAGESPDRNEKEDQVLDVVLPNLDLMGELEGVSSADFDIQLNEETGEVSWSGQPVSIQMGEGGKSDSVKWGGQNYTAPLSKKEGMEGYTVTSIGEFRLDPLFSQYQLRGYSTNYGKYTRLMNLPIFDGIWEEMVQGIVTMARRIEQRELPRALKSTENQHALDSQMDYAEAIWWLMKEVGAQNRAEKFVDDVVRSVTKNGFYLGEIIAKRKMKMKLRHKGEVEALIPEVPKHRLANAVRYWILEGDEIKGIIFDFTATAWPTGIGDNWKIIPIGKFVHVFGRSEGVGNPEGRSAFRSQLTMSEMLRDAFVLEALAIEVNALGTLLVRVKEDTGEDDVAKLREHIQQYRAADVPAIVSEWIDEAKYMSPQAAIPEVGGPITRYERNITWAHGREGRLIGVQKHGSNAARESGQSQGLTFNPYIVQMYVEHAAEQVFRRMITANKKIFQDDVDNGRLFVPQMIHGVAEGLDTAKLTVELTQLVNSGILTAEEAGSIIRPAYGLKTEDVINEQEEAPRETGSDVQEEPREGSDGGRPDERVDHDEPEERGR